MMDDIFWFSVVFVFYAYWGYPVVLILISSVKSLSVKKGDISPSLSFIITAYNEEKQIRAKLDNTLKLTYPEDQLEIIVASDCSTDRTDEIVRSYGPRGVRLVRSPKRKGKEFAQKHAVENSTGEILVFSDVATVIEPQGLTAIVRNFNDPSVGCVSSVDRFVDSDGKISGEGAYVKYEMFLRQLETRVNSVVGLSGSFFAARREVCKDWAENLQSDFNTLLNSIRLGLRGVSDSDSIGFYRNIRDGGQEFDRKVRTVLRCITVMMNSLPLLNPLKYRLFAWQLLSHKLCRWLVPFAMIGALLSNLLLSFQSVFYLSILVIQGCFYGLAFAIKVMNGAVTRSFLKLPWYLVEVNLSILYAWYRYIRGERMAVWSPSER